MYGALGAGITGLGGWKALELARRGYRWLRGRRAPVKKYRKKSFTNRVRAIARGVLENKHKDLSLTNGTWYTGNSYIYAISDQVTQGDDESQRDGDTIQPTSLQIRGIITTNAAASSDTIVRVILFRWKEDMTTAHTAPTIGKILNTDAIDSFSNWDDTSNYTKLMDKVITIPLRTDGTNVVGANRPLKYYKKFKVKTRKCTFDGAGSGNGRKNHYFIIFMSNQASGYQPTFDGTFRFTFKD